MALNLEILDVISEPRVILLHRVADLDSHGNMTAHAKHQLSNLLVVDAIWQSQVAKMTYQQLEIIAAWLYSGSGSVST